MATTIRQRQSKKAIPMTTKEAQLHIMFQDEAYMKDLNWIYYLDNEGYEIMLSENDILKLDTKEHPTVIFEYFDVLDYLEEEENNK